MDIPFCVRAKLWLAYKWKVVNGYGYTFLCKSFIQYIMYIFILLVDNFVFVKCIFVKLANLLYRVKKHKAIE